MRFLTKISLLLAVLALFASCETHATDDTCCIDYAYNYPTRYQQGCCLWEGNIDVLYLEARNSFAPVELGNSSTFNTTPQELAYDWKAAFRVGVGANLPGDRFAVDLDWLHYRTDAQLSSDLSGDQSNFLIPYFEVIIDPSNQIEVLSSDYSSYSRLHLNEINLSVHREYVLTPGIVLSPKIGVTYLDIKSTLSLSLIPHVQFGVSPFIEVKTQNRFYGLGIKGGIDSMWNLGCGFGLFSELQTGLIWGRYQTSTPFITPDGAPQHARYVHQNLVPTLDFGVGIIFDNRFDDGSDLRLKAGWEGFYYYDQTTINLEPQLISHPLTLQGVVLSISYSM